MSAAALAGLVAAGSPLAALAGLLVPVSRRALVAGASTVILGALGVSLGVMTITSGVAPVHLGWLIPLAGVTIAGDATSGLFILVTGAVAVAVGIYLPGYYRDARAPAAPLATLPIFVAAMLLLPLAASVTTFLALWELMALASLVLVLTEHRHAEARSAGLLYAVMTQLGFLAIVIGLAVLAAGAGTESSAGVQHASEHLSPGLRSTVFLLTVVGFGSKAGLLPLHAWLARAHPEAPSPVSALLSAAMVNLGIYGIIRIDLTVLGPGARWWGLLLLVVGAITAVYAVLQAAVATDLKRLLAFSTSENMGLITLGIGASMLLAADRNPAAAVAMTAALLQVVSHAAFKTLGFLSAGSVLKGTGIRDLDRLGGLARPMPATTTLFGIAALGAAGLPLGAGFVSEWLLLQAMISALPTDGTTLALAMPPAVGAVALTTGVGVAAMVKAFGVGFLARPRSAEAAGATEAAPSMLVGAGLAAAACAVLATAPVLLSGALRDALAALPNTTGTPSPHLGLLLRLPGVAGSISPALLAAGLTAAVLIAVALSGVRARRPGRRCAPRRSGRAPARR